MNYEFQIGPDIIGGSDIAETAGVGAVLIIYLILIAVGALIGLASYIVYSLGIYRLAKTLFVSNAFLAWIPYAQYYTLGKIAERCDEQSGNQHPRPWGKINLLGTIGAVAGAVVLVVLCALCAFIPIIGILLMVVLYLAVIVLAYVPLVMDAICRWKIYREFFPETVNVVLFIVGLLTNTHAIITLIASFRQPRVWQTLTENDQAGAGVTYESASAWQSFGEQVSGEQVPGEQVSGEQVSGEQVSDEYRG